MLCQKSNSGAVKVSHYCSSILSIYCSPLPRRILAHKPSISRRLQILFQARSLLDIPFTVPFCTFEWRLQFLRLLHTLPRRIFPCPLPSNDSTLFFQGGRWQYHPMQPLASGRVRSSSTISYGTHRMHLSPRLSWAHLCQHSLAWTDIVTN